MAQPHLTPVDILEDLRHLLSFLSALIPFLGNPVWHLQVRSFLLLHDHSANACLRSIAKQLLG
jgi:hypothetical protein